MQCLRVPAGDAEVGDPGKGGRWLGKGMNWAVCGHNLPVTLVFSYGRTADNAAIERIMVELPFATKTVYRSRGRSDHLLRALYCHKRLIEPSIGQVLRANPKLKSSVAKIREKRPVRFDL